MVYKCVYCKVEFKARPYDKRKFCSQKCYQFVRFGRKHSEETKRKMSIAAKGIKKSAQHRKNTSLGRKGKYTREKCPSWKGGKFITGGGYVVIHSPNHPFCNARGYVQEHRLVMEEHLGRYLTPIELVHHINKDKLNNRIENLMLFPNNSSHATFHQLLLKSRNKPIQV